MYITKITKKGQITIPAEYRKKLGADYYVVEIKGGELVVKPFNSPAGSLKKYAKKDRSIGEIIEEERDVLGEVFLEKHKEKHKDS